MIKTLYILTDGGINLFTKEYQGNLIDKTLISGFLSAIFTFAKSIDSTGIQEINIKNHIVYYKAKKSIIIVMIADSTEDPKQIEDLTTRILPENQVY